MAAFIKNRRFTLLTLDSAVLYFLIFLRNTLYYAILHIAISDRTCFYTTLDFAGTDLDILRICFCFGKETIYLGSVWVVFVLLVLALQRLSFLELVVGLRILQYLFITHAEETSCHAILRRYFLAVLVLFLLLFLTSHTWILLFWLYAYIFLVLHL